MPGNAAKLAAVQAKELAQRGEVAKVLAPAKAK